jgi:ribosomal-protein-alanine N-acetyltransferase
MNGEGFRIRKASERDLQAIYEIEKRSFKDPYPLFFIEFLLKTNPNTFLVAENNSCVIGYVIATNKEKIGSIVSIAIAPEERRKHVGQTLMEKVIDALKDMRVTTVRLEVRKSNVAAQRFYKALGFSYSHEIPRYYGDENALVYYRRI